MTQQRLGVVSQFTHWAKMVGWYDPAQLARTGARVLVSTLFTSYDDRRAADKLTAGDEAALPTDYSLDEAGAPRDALWIDYVADLGDGWHSTYQVAYALSRRSLALRDPSGAVCDTRRGDVLIFGGDQVYPTASRQTYQDRLVRPYEAALRDSEAPHPHIYAVPGNHDWYDNLVAFRSLFCTGRWFAGWRTRQRTSYFALKLPHGWWLVGTDVQLDSDIDAAQLAYFRDVAARMAPDDQIILCVAEPHWIYARAYGKSDDNCNESNLAFLEQRVFNRKIAVYLAGDLHHYRRHANEEGAQKITCGGGGAFLHPTHGPDVDVLHGGYTVRSAFPTPRESRRLCWRNLLFQFINPKFGVITAILYTLLAWSVNVNVSIYGMPQYGDVAQVSLAAILQNQSAVMWMAILCGGFVLFTEAHSRSFRWIAGTLHALTHLSAVFCLGWWATFFTVQSLGLPFGSIRQLLLAGTLIFGLGWLVGSLVMGLYFIIALNGFGRHTNEAFSSLRSPDWKSFLRMRVDATGVTIYPVGIRRVWKAWRINPGGPESPEWIPDYQAPRRQHGIEPALIESPIIVKRS
ncbi:MAG TPA: metallophosphoesterase [Gemmatimonadaceae bacterium]